MMEASGRRHSSLTTRVLKAMSIFGSVELLNIACAIIRTKLVALWIGAAGVGVISLYNATLDMLRTVFQLNVGQSSVREIAASSAEERFAVAYATRRLGLWLGIIATVLTAALSPLLSLTTFGSYDYTWGFVALSATLFASTMMESRRAVLQGLGMLRPMARAAAFGAAVSTACAVPLFYFFRMSAIVPVLAIFSFTSMTFMMLPKVPRGAKPLPDVTRRNMSKMIRLGAYLTIATAITILSNYLLRIYLNSVADLPTVGRFQAGYTILNSYVGVIFTAISVEYFPRLSSTIKRQSYTRITVAHEVSVVTWILMPFVVAFICADELIVRILYSSEFLEILPYLSVSIVGTLFRGVSWSMAFVIVAKGDGRTFVVTETISSVLVLGFGIVGWHYLGYVGLGLAYVAEFLVYTIMVAAVCRRRYQIELPRSVMLLAVSAIAIALLALAAKFYVGWWLPAVAILPWLIPLSIRRLMR